MADRLNELKVKQAENALREKENAYQPQKIEQKPDNPKEAANIAGCAGCTTRDCANCSKGGAKVAMLEKLQSLREKQEAALPQTQNQNQYKPPETQAKPQQTKQERINVTGCEACTSKDCANCSKGGAKALMHEKLQALKDKQGEYKPPETQAKPQQTKQERINVTGCDGCTTRDCASCSKGGGKAALAARLNELKEQQQQKTYTPREQKSESYKAPEVIQKPDTVNERANLDACAGCTSRDCANCSKGGAKAAMTAKLSALKEQQSNLAQAVEQEKNQYKPAEIVNKPSDVREAVNVDACAGCTTRDCANCSKGSAKDVMAFKLAALKEKQGATSSVAAEESKDAYRAPEVKTKIESKNEAANVDACAGCTTRDCANCSKGGAKAAMTAKLSALKSKQQGLEAKTAETDEAYKTSKIYAHAENKMDEAEIVHASGCEGCTTRDCANCSKGGAKALLADELKKLRGRQSQAQPELANRAA